MQMPSMPWSIMQSSTRFWPSRSSSPASVKGVGAIGKMPRSDALSETATARYRPKSPIRIHQSATIPGPPIREVAMGLFVGRRIQAEDRASSQHFLGHEVFERRHLDRLLGDLIREMRWNDNDTFRVANDDVAREYRRIAASNRNIDVERLVNRQVGGPGRTMMIGRNG